MCGIKKLRARRPGKMLTIQREHCVIIVHVDKYKLINFFCVLKPPVTRITILFVVTVVRDGKKEEKNPNKRRKMFVYTNNKKAYADKKSTKREKEESSMVH